MSSWHAAYLLRLSSCECHTWHILSKQLISNGHATYQSQLAMSLSPSDYDEIFYRRMLLKISEIKLHNLGIIGLAYSLKTKINIITCTLKKKSETKFKLLNKIMMSWTFFCLFPSYYMQKQACAHACPHQLIFEPNDWLLLNLVVTISCLYFVIS